MEEKTRMKKLGFLLALVWGLGLLIGMAPGPAHAQGATATITGKALEGDGTPVQGAPISAWTEADEGANSHELARTTTGADGSYSLQVPANQPIWVHFNTYQGWWGYAYSPPPVPKPGETITGINFVLGPRNVFTPIPTAPPAPPATAVPATYTGSVGGQVISNPTPTPPPPGMPTTGDNSGDGWLPVGIAALAVLLLGLGTGLRALRAGARR
jgi:hypothetical protein